MLVDVLDMYNRYMAWLESHISLHLSQVYCITGEWEWYCQEFGFPYAMEDHPCAWCSADMHDEIPCFDFRTCATWRGHVYSSDEMNRKYKHPLFKVPALNSQCIFLDVLHSIDLGVSCHVCGSVLWDLIEDEMPQSNRPDRCVAVNRLVVEMYNALGTPANMRVGVLKLTDIRESAKEFPCLLGASDQKAAWLVGMAG